jgi:hypothetical protein
MGAPTKVSQFFLKIPKTPKIMSPRILSSKSQTILTHSSLIKHEPPLL